MKYSIHSGISAVIGACRQAEQEEAAEPRGATLSKSFAHLVFESLSVFSREPSRLSATQTVFKYLPDSGIGANVQFWRG